MTEMFQSPDTFASGLTTSAADTGSDIWPTSPQRDIDSGVTVFSSTAAVSRSLPTAWLPEPHPEWSDTPVTWSKHWWPLHVYGFAVTFSFGTILSLTFSVNCFRRQLPRHLSPSLAAVNVSVGAACAVSAAVLLIDAYHSAGILPVAVLQLMHGLPFPVLVATLTVLDRVFSALVRSRPVAGN